MKKYILPFMSIAMLMAMASCSSSDDAVAENKAVSKLVPMTFTATQESNVGTRSALNNSNGVDWQTSDMISVFDAVGDGHNQRFTLTGDAREGIFSGEASSEATSFTAVYPYTDGAQLKSDGSVSGITLPAEQTATPNSFDPAAALMMAVSTEENKNQLDFKNAVSLVKVTTQFACKKIVLSANENIAGKGKLTYNSGAPSISFDSNQSQTVTLKPATVSNSFAAGTYYMVVPSITLNGFTITFTDENDKEYTRKSTNSNTFNRSKIKDFGSFATSGDYWYDASRGDKVRADQEVDMGLTVTISGVNYKVIFAKTNLTATGLAENEYDYGDYFAWGATEPWCTQYSRTGTGNDVQVSPMAWENTQNATAYDWSNVPFRDGNNNFCNQYINNGDKFAMEHDAARQILGGDWQLPTIEIWQALNTSSYTWTLQSDGIIGREVKNKSTSVTLFLPAAGFVDVTSFKYVGSYGRYWSCTAYTSTQAYYQDFSKYSVSPQVKDRYYGFSVRPVRLVEVSQTQQ